MPPRTNHLQPRAGMFNSSPPSKPVNLKLVIPIFLSIVVAIIIISFFFRRNHEKRKHAATAEARRRAFEESDVCPAYSRGDGVIAGGGVVPMVALPPPAYRRESAPQETRMGGGPPTGQEPPAYEAGTAAPNTVNTAATRREDAEEADMGERFHMREAWPRRENPPAP